MAKYILTKKAVSDLSSIWEYTMDYWAENQADIYYKKLVNNFVRIGEDQNIGKKYNRITNGLLGLKVGRHIIFYKTIAQSKVEIIRILHEQMDLDNRILE